LSDVFKLGLNTISFAGKVALLHLALVRYFDLASSETNLWNEKSALNYIAVLFDS
jgi:hypothetical protein